jgi:exosortase C (VPDSG-CTERM-specific)
MNTTAAPGDKPLAPSFPAHDRTTLVRTLLALGCLSLAYAGVILDLFGFARENELYSHLPLIPLIVAYLIWGQRVKLASTRAMSSPGAAGAVCFLGLALVSGYGVALAHGWSPSRQDKLFVLILSYLLIGLGLALYFLGKRWLWTIAFPLGMLLLMPPLPLGVERGMERFLQEASAEAAWVLFQMVGAPVIHNGLVFDLPDLPIKVAQECSGIRSSLVLVITSLIASYLFLRGYVRRTLLFLITIPLGIVRNGFRIFVIGELCVYGGPDMLNSWVHKKGGPLFFVLSLSVLWVALAVLRAGERPRASQVAAVASSKQPAAG